MTVVWTHIRKILIFCAIVLHPEGGWLALLDEEDEGDPFDGGGRPMPLPISNGGPKEGLATSLSAFVGSLIARLYCYIRNTKTITATAGSRRGGDSFRISYIPLLTPTYISDIFHYPVCACPPLPRGSFGGLVRMRDDMTLTPTQQIHQLLEGKKHILITFKKGGLGDAIGSAVALFLFLEKRGQRADIVVDEFSLPRQFHFLKKAKEIKSEFAHLQKFILTVDVKDTGVQELSYDVKDEKLRIFITPKSGFLTRDHVRTAQTDFKYDLIITVDTPDLASLGGIYANNTDLFFKTPIIAIDHDSGNEHFGQVNLIDMTVTSTAEVVYDLLKKLGEEYIDADIATAILTGMISKTRSFRGDNVKPSTLATAGKLVSVGANRDYIVQNLYRTRSLSTLKLWGEALSHLQSDRDSGVVWTSITRDDFIRAGAREEELQDIIDELIGNSPEAKIIVLLHEHVHNGDTTRQIHCIVSVEKNHDARALLAPYQPNGNKKQASCLVMGKNLKEAEDEVIETIRRVIRDKR